MVLHISQSSRTRVSPSDGLYLGNLLEWGFFLQLMSSTASVNWACSFLKIMRKNQLCATNKASGMMTNHGLSVSFCWKTFCSFPGIEWVNSAIPNVFHINIQWWNVRLGHPGWLNIFIQTLKYKQSKKKSEINHSYVHIYTFIL